MTDHEQHPTQGTPDPSEPERSEVDRRTFLKGAGTFGAAALSGPFLSKNWAFLSGGRSGLAATPIEHAIISCQENRSFDHYFGYAPFVGSHGVPSAYSQPDGAGGSVAPYRFTELSTPDVPHSWSDIHEQWNGGAMDGFYTDAGIWAMGYYTAEELPF